MDTVADRVPLSAASRSLVVCGAHSGDQSEPASGTRGSFERLTPRHRGGTLKLEIFRISLIPDIY